MPRVETCLMGLQIEEAIGGKRQMLMDTWQVHRFIPFSVDIFVSKRDGALEAACRKLSPTIPSQFCR
jgi:hypothetical protein